MERCVFLIGKPTVLETGDIHKKSERMTAVPETMEHVDKWSAHRRHLELTFDFAQRLEGFGLGEKKSRKRRNEPLN